NVFFTKRGVTIMVSEPGYETVGSKDLTYFKKLFFLQFFPRAEQERLKREYHSIRQTNTETSTEFMQRFLRLAGFLGAAAGTEEEQAKNFQWGLRRLNFKSIQSSSTHKHDPNIMKDCKKNTTASTSGQADKKPSASGHVFAITKGHAANTLGTITGTLFLYGHAVFVLFDTGATHSVISSAFASRV
nr:zinc finger, CCHC-type, retrotransposon Gag domain protein [Tanacetum cinerariifolium]